METRINITDNNQPIGLMDSGVGGLTVLKEISNITPNESIVYIGDDTNCPYGEKSPEEITNLSIKMCDRLMAENVKMIVIACNTISAICYNKLNNYCSVPVIGIIDPGVEAALNSTNNNCVGVLATRATIDSGIYENKLLEKNSELKIINVAAPKFVDLVETETEMVLNNPNEELNACLKDYCKPFKDNNCDTVIMACTHFPLLEPLLQKELGENVSLVSPSKNTAEKISKILKNDNLNSDSSSEYKFIATGPNPNKFKGFWSLI